MKTWAISVSLDDTEAELLLSKYTLKEMEGLISREAYSVLGALVNQVKNDIPYIETLAPEELFND